MTVTLVLKIIESWIKHENVQNRRGDKFLFFKIIVFVAARHTEFQSIKRNFGLALSFTAEMEKLQNEL